MERDDRQVAVVVANELRLVMGLTVRCDCGKRKDERRDEDRTGRTEEGESDL